MASFKIVNIAAASAATLIADMGLGLPGNGSVAFTDDQAAFKLAQRSRDLITLIGQGKIRLEDAASGGALITDTTIAKRLLNNLGLDSGSAADSYDVIQLDSAGKVPYSLDFNSKTASNAVLSGASLSADLAAGVNKITGLAAGSAAGHSVRYEQVGLISGANAWTAAQSMGGNKITSLGTPTVAADAATKGYVDSTVEGLDVKASVRLATDAPLSAYSGTTGTLTASAFGALSVDGVAVALDDRVLVKNEATGARNGLYKVTAIGGVGASWVLARPADFDVSADVTAGAFVFVTEGTVNADSGWVMTSNDVVTLETTALAWSQFSGAGQITAGAGLTKSGNTINAIAGSGIVIGADDIAISLGANSGLNVTSGLVVDASLAGNGLSLATGALAVNVDNASIELSADALRVKASGVTNAMLANSAVTVTAGNGLTDGGAVALGASVALNIGAGTGISVAADNVAVDQAFAPTWTGKHIFEDESSTIPIHKVVLVATAAALPTYTRTGNVITATVNGALAAIDGVTLVLNDRLLFRNGVAGSDNGLYFVSQVGVAGVSPYTLTRTTDADSAAEVSLKNVFVRKGTAYAGTLWTSDSVTTLGTDTLTYRVINALLDGNGLSRGSDGKLAVGAGSGITVNAADVALATSAAGAGLTYTTGVLAVGAGSGITVNADDVALASTAAGAGLTYTTGVLAVGAGSGITVNADDVAVIYATTEIANLAAATEAAGTSATAARGDHVHAHGDVSGDAAVVHHDATQIDFDGTWVNGILSGTDLQAILLLIDDKFKTAQASGRLVAMGAPIGIAGGVNQKVYMRMGDVATSAAGLVALRSGKISGASIKLDATCEAVQTYALKMEADGAAAQTLLTFAAVDVDEKFNAALDISITAGQEHVFYVERTVADTGNPASAFNNMLASVEMTELP